MLTRIHWAELNDTDDEFTRYGYFNLYRGIVTGGADLDNDGEIDLVTTEASLWNGGGDFTLNTIDTSAEALANGVRDDVLQIVSHHNGEAGNDDLVIASLAFMFDDGTGDPGDNSFSLAELNAIVDHLRIYEDNGDGVFCSGDINIYDAATLQSSNGVVVATLPNNSPYTKLAVGQNKTWFVTFDMEDLAHEQGHIRINHLTDNGQLAEGSSTGELASCDLDVNLAYSARVSATLQIAGDVAASLATETTSIGVQNQFTFNDIFKVTATHSGLVDAELATIALQFDDGTGDPGSNPLSTAEVRELVAEVSIYLDDGSGGFSPIGDTRIVRKTSPTVNDDGILILKLPDNSDDTLLSNGEKPGSLR